MSLKELKQYLRVDYTDDDSMIELMHDAVIDEMKELFEYHTFLHHSQTSNLKMNCFHLHKTGTQTSDGY